MHKKEIKTLQAEKENIERQLAQEQHKRCRQHLCANLFAGSG